jgi:ribosomal RNA assembly protein
VEENTYTSSFPKYLGKYLREIWPKISELLSSYGICGEINLSQYSISVRTTDETRDPYIIFKAKELILLITRSVPIQHAVRIFQDDIASEIFSFEHIIKSNVRSSPPVLKTLKNIIGAKGSTLKALELLTKCYISIDRNTICVIGSYAGIKTIASVIEGCVKNIHPLYHLKNIILKNQLRKNVAMKNSNWLRGMSQQMQVAAKRSKPLKSRRKVFYKSFPEL